MSWVNEQLQSYALTADVEQTIADALQAAKDADATLKEELEKDIKDVSDDLKTAKDAFDDQIRTAIKDACADGGVIDTVIADQFSAALTTFQNSIDALAPRVEALETKIAAAQKSLAEILTRIQSIAVVADSSVEVPGDVTFEILPVSAAKALVALEGAKDSLKFQAVEVETKGGESNFNDFVIDSLKMDNAGEFVLVSVSPNPDASWKADFKAGTLNLSARLLVEAYSGSGNYVCKTSEYFPVNYVAPVITTTGTAKAKLDGTSEVDVTWVQLWENGPKWATINVGATITDYASLATATADLEYLKNNYSPYITENVGGLYAWSTPGANARIAYWDSNVSCGTEDIATTLWGSEWKTPSQADFNNLRNYNDDGTAALETALTEWTWCDGSTTQYVSGCTLAGFKVSGKGAYASNSIFLPAASRYNSYQYQSNPGSISSNWSNMFSTTKAVFLWSSAPNPQNDAQAYYLYAKYNSSTSATTLQLNGIWKSMGNSVRAVLNENVIPITGITLSKTAASIKAGDTETLTATVSPDNATNKTLTWSSSNTAVATVDENGVVTGVSAGTATITATAHDGSGVSASCIVTVEHASVQLWEGGPYWATTNIGASTPEEYGYYFAWGYTEGCVRNSADDGWVLASDGTTAKQFNTTDFPNRSDSAFQDAATAAWGSDWRMPTDAEFKTLINKDSSNKCTVEYVTEGVKGIKITGTETGYTANSIFLPAAGYGNGSDLSSAGAIGYYWSSTQSSSGPACGLRFIPGNDGTSRVSNYNRFIGYSVRPVRSSL